MLDPLELVAAHREPLTHVRSQCHRRGERIKRLLTAQKHRAQIADTLSEHAHQRLQASLRTAAAAGHSLGLELAALKAKHQRCPTALRRRSRTHATSENVLQAVLLVSGRAQHVCMCPLRPRLRLPGLHGRDPGFGRLPLSDMPHAGQAVLPLYSSRTALQRTRRTLPARLSVIYHARRAPGPGDSWIAGLSAVPIYRVESRCPRHTLYTPIYARTVPCVTASTHAHICARCNAWIAYQGRLLTLLQSRTLPYPQHNYCKQPVYS